LKYLKFRAWDKARKEFLSAGQLLISVEAGKRPKSSHIYLDILTDADKYLDRFEIMQYTGIKDKNGKEIYEGDIIRVDWFGWVAEVKWDGDNGRFIGFTFGNERKIVYVDREPKVEVIGNIYENPELLKQSL
jgi:uncharacterized phage protein (TIGR01671 family)